MSDSTTIEQAIQAFWAEQGFAAPNEWPESSWPAAWVWTEEQGGVCRRPEDEGRLEEYASRFRVRSAAEGWNQLGWKEAKAMRDTCLAALEDEEHVTFGDTVDGIDSVEYSKVEPVRIATPTGEAAHWEWTINLTVLTSR